MLARSTVKIIVLPRFMLLLQKTPEITGIFKRVVSFRELNKCTFRYKRGKAYLERGRKKGGKYSATGKFYPTLNIFVGKKYVNF